MRLGLSPFGIWRPGTPPGITGLDAYADIFADSKKWLENGWADYFAPQLYWPLSSTGQNFTALLDWWLSVNTRRRHLWPGLAAYRVADGSTSAYAASEITAELTAVRLRGGASAGGASGAILYNTTSIRLNRGGLADALILSSYSSPGIVPAFPWLDAIAMPAPTIAAELRHARTADARRRRIAEMVDGAVADDGGVGDARGLGRDENARPRFRGSRRSGKRRRCDGVRRVDERLSAGDLARCDALTELSTHDIPPRHVRRAFTVCRDRGGAECPRSGHR
jgi:hypothetical protein